MYREHSIYNMSKTIIGKQAPEFTLEGFFDNEFKTFSLDDYKGKYVVFFFYPNDFTFVCPTEIIAFSDRYKEFEEIDTVVLGCSCDSKYSHFAWISQSRKEGGLGQMNIPILSDFTKRVARDYGVLKEEEGSPFRGLFIIDRGGVLRQITINDTQVGRSVDEILRLVKAFQYTDVHGEVCPANWKPGDKTMKPSIQESKEYFEKKNNNEN
uniref:thioredoxin-dependent peroxiredoxin n=1 Tax=Parastrongyloides trichosuri TaxID=131310 RepID=A0A0N4ZSW6_PARTI